MRVCAPLRLLGRRHQGNSKWNSARWASLRRTLCLPYAIGQIPSIYSRPFFFATRTLGMKRVVHVRLPVPVPRRRGIQFWGSPDAPGLHCSSTCLDRFHYGFLQRRRRRRLRCQLFLRRLRFARPHSHASSADFVSLRSGLHRHHRRNYPHAVIRWEPGRSKSQFDYLHR
jgi:hypothetical protein